MPTYEYSCKSCGHHWEATQRITEDPIKECPACGKPTAQRLISGGNFILKGRGWYADLYSKPPAGNGSDKTSSSSSEKQAADKPATKSEKKGNTDTSSKTTTSSSKTATTTAS